MTMEHGATGDLSSESSLQHRCDDESAQGRSLSDKMTSLSAEEIISEVGREMGRLSIKERTEAIEDVHGVLPPPTEDPQFVQQKLLEMKHILANREVLGVNLFSRTRQDPGYQVAVAGNSSYVHNDARLLMFLRADQWDVVLATRRFLNFWEHKMELFGIEKLCRDITLNDLDEEDMVSLESGAVQECLQTDRSGRAVICVFQQLRKFIQTENMLRTVYYIFIGVVEGRPEVQKRGHVVVFYNTSQNKDFQLIPSLAWKLIELRRALPLPLGTRHLCLRSTEQLSVMEAMLPLFWKMSPNAARVRSSYHFGTDLEIRHKLMGYGIPMELFPAKLNGSIALSSHFEWIRRRRELEAAKEQARQ